MGKFFEQYKILDGRCKELLSSDKGVTGYIEIMTKIPEYYHSQIDGFDSDLKKLKHYRHIRNEIAHEEGACEETLCKESDAQWLCNFCKRIETKQDPVAQYNKLLRQDKQRTVKEKKAFPLWKKLLLGGTALAGAIAAVLAKIFSNKD